MDTYLKAYADLVDAPNGLLSFTISSAIGSDLHKANGDWQSRLPGIAGKWMNEVDIDFNIDDNDAGKKMAQRINDMKPDVDSWNPTFIGGFANVTFTPPYIELSPGSPSYSPFSNMADTSICEQSYKQNQMSVGQSNEAQPVTKPVSREENKPQSVFPSKPSSHSNLNYPEPKRLKQTHEPTTEHKSSFFEKKSSSFNLQEMNKQTNTKCEPKSIGSNFEDKKFKNESQRYDKFYQNCGFVSKQNEALSSNQGRSDFAPKQSRFEEQSSYQDNEDERYGNYKCPPPAARQENEKKPTGPFVTARTELIKQNLKKYGHAGNIPERFEQPNAPVKRSLGGRTRIVNSALKKNEPEPETMESCGNEELDKLVSTNEEYKAFVNMIESEVMDVKNKVTWDDIAGLKHVKEAIEEIVVMPLLCPEIFNGLRAPPKGLLLFGPPGTGKTMIGKCIASEANATFFSVSASTVTSKWFGTGEKMVKTLFAVARAKQPSVVFIDEIDSLLTSRTENEHESNRRMKTEFLVQMDGVGGCEEDRVLVVGATNRPQELDDAARRRLQKRLYVPLPDHEARQYLVQSLISKHSNSMDEESYHQVAVLTDGYSCADLTYLCKEASMGPIRGISSRVLVKMRPHEIPPVLFCHFEDAVKVVKPSVASETLKSYEEWNTRFGFGG